MEVICDQVIQDIQLSLDEKSFVNCVLERCILEYSGGNVSFDQTIFRGCKYVFFGRARATVHFLQAVGMVTDEAALWAEFPEAPN